MAHWHAAGTRISISSIGSTARLRTRCWVPCSRFSRSLPAAAPPHVSAEASFEALRSWITNNGGYVHPVLQLVDKAPASSCRGMIASQPISLEELEDKGPLISVPVSLQLTEEVAVNLLREHLGPAAAAQAQEQLSATQLIAAALAQQLGSGSSSSSESSSSSSRWHPYLATLPSQPPSPWLLSDPAELAACIEPYRASQGSHAVAGWAEATADYRQQMLQACQEVARLLGHHSQQPDAQQPQHRRQQQQQHHMTAMGHVTSRMLSSTSSSGLTPCIDLLNHGPEAGAPFIQLDEQDQLVITVLPIRNGEAVAMAAGEELLISYHGGYSPLESFLKFGWVSDEWW